MPPTSNVIQVLRIKREHKSYGTHDIIMSREEVTDNIMTDEDAVILFANTSDAMLRLWRDMKYARRDPSCTDECKHDGPHD